VILLSSTICGHFSKFEKLFLFFWWLHRRVFFERNPQLERMFQLYPRANWLIQSLVYISYRSTDRLTGNQRKHREISVNRELNIVYFSKCGNQGNSSTEIFWQCLFWHLTPPGGCKEHFLYIDTEMLCGPGNVHTWITYHENFLAIFFWHLTPPGCGKEQFLYLYTGMLCGPENVLTWVTFQEKYFGNINFNTWHHLVV
jgi:hypothetical protein